MWRPCYSTAPRTFPLIPCLLRFIPTPTHTVYSRNTNVHVSKCSLVYFAFASHLTLCRFRTLDLFCALPLIVLWFHKTYGPQVWETESAGIFNLTECIENGVQKCAQYWPEFDEREEFILGDGSSIFVTRIAKDPLQDAINVIEEDLSTEQESSKAREAKQLTKMIADKDKFEVRTFHLERGGVTREVTQYHVKFWKDHAGLLGDGQAEMRDFLHFLVEQVDAHCRNMDSGPPIIHCRQVHLPCAKVNSTGDIRSCSYL